jgi:hypothetical protein
MAEKKTHWNDDEKDRVATKRKRCSQIPENSEKGVKNAF